MKSNQADIEKAVADFTPSGKPVDDLLTAARQYFAYVENHKAVFLLGLRDPAAYRAAQEEYAPAAELFNQLLYKKVLQEYAIKDETKVKLKLQNFFTVLYGREALKFNFPQSTDLSKSDTQFINENMRLLAEEVFADMNE